MIRVGIGVFTSVALAALFGVFGCSSEPSAGNSMETENSIAFRLVGMDGKPAPFAKVRIRPDWLVSDSAEMATSLYPDSLVRNTETDIDGSLEVKGLADDNFTAEFILDSLKGLVEFSKDSASNLKQVQLAKTGSLKGIVTLPFGVSKAWIQIYGLDYIVATDSSGAFLLDSLPVGSFRLRAIVYGDTDAVEKTASIEAGDTTDVGTFEAASDTVWMYSQKIAVDSIASDWMAPLADTFVATLRLDSENFNFNLSKSNGNDLRFSDAAGNTIACDIVRFDPSAKRAVIRLRLNASLAGDSIVMRYGLENAPAPSVQNIWQDLSDSLVLALNSVTVGTFESNSGSDNTAYLPDPIPNGYWFCSHYPDSATATLSFESDDPDHAGTYAHFTYAVPSETVSWTLLGLAFKNSLHSLATLDSIEFYAKGSGKLSVAFEKNIAGDSVSQGKSWKHFQLDSLWTRYAVAPSDLLAADSSGGNIGWESVKDSITNISFFGANADGFFIDDIVLYGINRDDLK